MKKLFLLPVLLVATLATATDIAYSPPVGGMTVTVPTGQTRSAAVPLLHAAVGAGAMVGRIGAVGINYIDNSTANWTAGGLSTAANPYYLRIKTGAAAGRVLMVSTTANTTSRVFLTNDGTDLTQLGITTGVNGDVYELVLADTLSTLFGGILQGGVDANLADNVQVWANTAWVNYYYNTTRSRWERSTDTGASPDRSNFLLRPERGVLIIRHAATDLKMYVTGRAPDVGGQYFHSRAGSTFLSLGSPTDITLGSLSLNTRVAGWRNSAVTADATGTDQIQVWNNTAWTNYYYDAVKSSWQRSTDISASPTRNAVVIPAGRPFMIIRLDTAAALASLTTFPLNYTIAQ